MIHHNMFKKTETTAKFNNQVQPFKKNQPFKKKVSDDYSNEEYRIRILKFVSEILNPVLYFLFTITFVIYFFYLHTYF